MGKGRPKGTKNRVVLPDLKNLIAPHVPSLVARLVEIANGSDPKMAVSAIGMLLDRCLGRPVQPVAGSDFGPVKIEVSWLAPK